MTTQSLVKKQPPSEVSPSRQYYLFTQFFGDSDQLSNTIELWDAIPKYAVSARRQSAMRDEKGRLQVHEHRFAYRDRVCRLEIQPASIKVGGKYQDFYPSVDEELVEEVIRKIFANQQYGMHNAAAAESWVRFSISMIRKELATRGKTRSLDEIKHSIEILARTTIALYVDNQKTPVYTNAILSDLTRISRAEYLEDPSSLWIARLPMLISKSVNELSYRQFNYGAFMALDSQLARWLHKRLSHQYVNAGFMHDYTVLYSTLKRDSAMLEANRITKNCQALESALDELKNTGVLMDWSAEERRGARNRIDDVLYTLKAHPDFIADVKAANKRRKDAAENLGIRQPVTGRAGVVGGRDNFALKS